LESLVGYNLRINHLDGRILEVSSNSGHVTKPDEIHTIENEGMPVVDNPSRRGNLLIKFNVVFPDSISEESKTLLSKILPAPAPLPSLEGDLPSNKVTASSFGYISSSRERRPRQFLQTGVIEKPKEEDNNNNNNNKKDINTNDQKPPQSPRMNGPMSPKGEKRKRASGDSQPTPQSPKIQSPKLQSPKLQKQQPPEQLQQQTQQSEQQQPTSSAQQSSQQDQKIADQPSPLGSPLTSPKSKKRKPNPNNTSTVSSK